MITLNKYILCVFLCFQTISCQIEYLREESCETVEGVVGKCVTIKSCEPFVVLLQEEPLSSGVVSLLKSAHCGFDETYPMVCCPQSSHARSLPTSTPKVTFTPNKVSFPSRVSLDYTTNQRLDLTSSLLTPPVCGVSNGSFGRVVGGVDAQLGDLPWMALLGYKDRQRFISWRCGGSLVSARHVLTAAHCIHRHEDELYVVRLGELDLGRDEDAAPVDVLVKRAVTHEEYDTETYSNDIGLITLSRDVEFTNLIRPICLPARPDLVSKSFVDYYPLVAGWGRTVFRGPSASHLQVAQVPVVENLICAKSFSDYTATIDERVLCAGWETGGRDACDGDSGGPLMQPDFDKEKMTSYFYQIGVISYGRGCAQAGFPGVYMRVTHYLPWIETHMFKDTD